MSLRTKLLIIATFSIVALLIAFLSAWRTAEMSQTFALRQAEASVVNAAREILRESSEAERKPKRRLPPHEEEIFDRYADAPTRSTAIALRRFADVSGGVCDENSKPQGFVSSTSDGANFPADASQIAQNACRLIASSQEFSTQSINLGSEIFYVAIAPLVENIDSPNRIVGAFAFRRIPVTGIFGDWFNLLTQLFLLMAAIGLAVFSFSTWRGWQRGMRQFKTGLAAISIDLSARIEQPETSELAEISRSINDLTANLESNLRREVELKKSLVQNEKLASLGRVAAGVAHEVRNPLASMKLKIQLAERHKFEPAKIGNTFGVLREEIDRLDNLIKRLLDAGRPAKLNFSRFSLAELIEQRLALLAEQLERQNVLVDFANNTKTGEAAEIVADSERVAQVFDNLFRNAREAMPDGGELKISLEKDSDVHLVRVSDTGGGISEGERERLFEPFFTTKDDGTGLGLAISREIAESHGGKIYSLDKAENGATFVVVLPSAQNLKG